MDESETTSRIKKPATDRLNFRGLHEPENSLRWRREDPSEREQPNVEEEIRPPVTMLHFSELQKNRPSQNTDDEPAIQVEDMMANAKASRPKAPERVRAKKVAVAIEKKIAEIKKAEEPISPETGQPEDLTEKRRPKPHIIAQPFLKPVEAPKSLVPPKMADVQNAGVQKEVGVPKADDKPKVTMTSEQVRNINIGVHMRELIPRLNTWDPRQQRIHVNIFKHWGVSKRALSLAVQKPAVTHMKDEGEGRHVPAVVTAILLGTELMQVAEPTLLTAPSEPKISKLDESRYAVFKNMKQRSKQPAAAGVELPTSLQQIDTKHLREAAQSAMQRLVELLPK